MQVVLGEEWANDGHAGVRSEEEVAAAALNVTETAQLSIAADRSFHGSGQASAQCGANTLPESTEAPAAGITSAGGLTG